MNLLWNRYTRNLMLRLVQLLPIRRGRVMCVCWGGEQYNCNPKEIVSKLCKNKQFEILFAFKEPQKFSEMLPSEVQSIEIGSFQYFKLLATSQFIISNTRIGGGLWWPFDKRAGQIYIQTMHGGHGMKKQELEVIDSLGEGYLKLLYEDSSRIDLMMSDSTFWTEKARTIFAYPKGEILEIGLPRNDIYFASREEKRCIKKRLCQKIGIEDSENIRFAIYCPTFRNSGRRDVYGFNPDKIISALVSKFDGDWYILISSHPNMSSYYHKIYDFSHPKIKDIGGEDLTPILAVGDVAITDYSSAGFEFALNKKPSFLLCRDLADYDRGVYFDMKSLPFPYAENDDELVRNILEFDNEKYQLELEAFNNNVIGLKETGHAAEAVVNWMIQHR